MRLEVQCKDRLGLTRELLDILASQHIDLRDIEIDKSGLIYLNFPEIDFDEFSQLMAKIRRLDGVMDVRKIQFLPSERRNTELLAVLSTLPDPVFSINLKGKIDTINDAVVSLFKLDKTSLIGQSATVLLSDFNVQLWLEESRIRQREPMLIDGMNYIMEIMPVYITDDSNTSILTSAVVIIKPAIEAQNARPFIPESSNLGFEHFVGSSTKYKQLISQAKKLSDIDQSLLIQGETGTGKEMLARACHNASIRSGKAFMVVNCAAMPDDVAETELFGYAPGAFPNMPEGKKGIIEQADGGTVFFDEISEMSPLLQIKLLRFIQDGNFRRVGEEKEIHVDVGIIGASKKELLELVEQGLFREDLYYRLNVLFLEIPPLRDRISDVVTLFDFFVAQLSKELGIVKPSIDEEVYDYLASYTWPGNVRQLRSTTLKALTQMDRNQLSTSHFMLPIVDKNAPRSLNINTDGSLDEIMKSYESSILSSLYNEFPSSRKLAKRLGVSHTAIANKLRDYGIGKK